ncbi:MAG: hypothetical protein SFV15_17660 [Polyangiaceae bacterium]|nr:hypothetical protein [Polyangiaceae bacterium]
MIKSKPAEALPNEADYWVALARSLDTPSGGDELAAPTWTPATASRVPQPPPRTQVPVRPNTAGHMISLGFAAAIGVGASLFLRQISSWDPRVERYRRYNGKFRRWW